MRLQAQAPAWVSEAIAERGLGVGVAVRAVHGLQEEMAEPERLESCRVHTGLGAGLRKNQLQLVSGALD